MGGKGSRMAGFPPEIASFLVSIRTPPQISKHHFQLWRAPADTWTATFLGFGSMGGRLWVYYLLWVLYSAGYIFSGPIPHQVCRFHVLEDITRAVLHALAQVRQELRRPGNVHLHAVLHGDAANK